MQHKVRDISRIHSFCLGGVALLSLFIIIVSIRIKPIDDYDIPVSEFMEYKNFNVITPQKNREEGTSFGTKILTWIDSLRGNLTRKPLSLGHGEGETQVDCSLISPYSPELCERVKQVVASEISIQAKRLADFLLKILHGDEVGALEMTPNLGGSQIERWQEEFNDFRHSPWNYGHVLSFGGGGGAGFQVYCGSDLLVSAGGGGGGGVEIDHDNSLIEDSLGRESRALKYKNKNPPSYSGGGGGGVRVYSPELQHGISLGCGSNGSKNAYDKGVNPPLFRYYLEQMKDRIRKCSTSALHVHGGGGGGGGISVIGPGDSKINLTKSHKEITFSLGYFYFYFGDATPEGNDLCSRVPCSQWRHFSKYVKSGPCAKRNISCSQ